MAYRVKAAGCVIAPRSYHHSCALHRTSALPQILAFPHSLRFPNTANQPSLLYHLRTLRASFNVLSRPENSRISHYAKSTSSRSLITCRSYAIVATPEPSRTHWKLLRDENLLSSRPKSLRSNSGRSGILLERRDRSVHRVPIQRRHGRVDKPDTVWNSMSVSAEIVKTPTADTPGTTLILRTASGAYVFGSQAEGTQRALVQHGTRLLKSQDFFLTGQANWANTGGFVGLMLTLADASSSSFAQAKEVIQAQRGRGRKVDDPVRPHFNIYGPPNLKHMLGTCRRFIFRKGLPIKATEYKNLSPEKDENGKILPSWQDSNIQVWALGVSPTRQQERSKSQQEYTYSQGAYSETSLEDRMRKFDAELNTFGDHQADENETLEDRAIRYDRIRDATIKAMFDSSWTFDTLVEQHVSKVTERTPMFIRHPESHKYEPYHGPRTGDFTVWTRTPWPGANIRALPPTEPSPISVSYIVRTMSSRGIFDAVKAKSLGIQPGPNFGKLASGQAVQNANGDWIQPEQVLGPDRPGQGLALLDVPTVGHLEAIVQREELLSPDVMSGIGAIIWMLAPGIAGHQILNDFIGKLNGVQHIISSTDVAPNRLGFDSVAGQATRLGQIDPARYSTPIYDNHKVPQDNLFNLDERQAPALPDGTVAADRGMSFILMPNLNFQKDNARALTDLETIKKETDTELLRLAQSAQAAVEEDHQNLQNWRQLLARPDTEVTTLGTGSAMPSKYRNVSATLVRVPGIGNYLFDCGENTLGQLSRLFPAEELADIIKNLRMIWISHLHADHHLGTASVIRAWYQLKHNSVPNDEPLNTTTIKDKPENFGLAVISHSGMLQWLNEYSSVEDFGYSRILPLEIFQNRDEKPSELHITNQFIDQQQDLPTLVDKSLYEKLFGFVDIQSASVAHCNGAMAVCVTFPRSEDDPSNVKPLKVSYSGDCRPSYHFGKIGRDTTVLIHEATFDDALQGDAIAKKHSTTSEALGVGSKMNAKAVVLTHFSQRYQKIPVLQTVTDNEQVDPMVDVRNTAQEANENEDDEVDPTLENTDNVDIHPHAPGKPPTTAPRVPSLQHQTSSLLADNERVIKIYNKDMKVAVAFDYMRVKIGGIAELEKFNEALNALLIKDPEVAEDDDGSTINANGKKTSGDEAGGGKKKKQKQKGAQGTPKKQKSVRNN